MGISDRIDRRFFFGRMSTSQAELAATVHFAAKIVEKRRSKSILTETEVLTEVMNWKQSRGPVFTEQRGLYKSTCDVGLAESRI